MYGAVKSAKHSNAAYAGDFRVALSFSPFTLNQFDAGYTFQVGNKTATTPAQLQQIYKDLGSTQMYVRLATKRHKTMFTFENKVGTAKTILLNHKEIVQ